MFGLLKNTIVGVKDTMDNTMGEIFDNLSELDILRCYFRRGTKIQTTNDIVKMLMTYVAIATFIIL